MPSRLADLALPVLFAAMLATTAPAQAAGPSTELVSLSSTGVKSNGESLQGAVSSDGRWVVFSSNSTTLVSPPTASGITNLFLRDRQRGATRQVTMGPGGAQPDGSASQPRMSRDGRFTAFYSNATTLANSPGGYQAFLYDRADGSIRRVSTNVTPLDVYDLVNGVSISGDGRKVAYTANDSGTSRSDVFVADVASGLVKRVGEAAPGVPGNGNVVHEELSGDGRWVGYATAATDVVPGDTNGQFDVVMENLETGVKERVSLRGDEAQANKGSFGPAIDYDGCLVAFASSATNLVVGGELTGTKTFVRDRCNGDTEAASVSNSGTVGLSGGFPAISEDGCAIVFTTSGIFSPPPGARAAALRDRCAGITTRLDVSTAGESANGATTPNSAALGGAGGRYAVFGSVATNLAGADTDPTTDFFLRDRATNRGPQALLGITQTGASVRVDATQSADSDGFAITGSISFGDGSPEVGALAAEHSYARGGTYTVGVTVTDADGATDRASRAVTVPDPPPPDGDGGPGGGSSGPGGGPGPGVGPLGGGAGNPPPLRLKDARLTRSRFAVAPTKGPAKGIQGTAFSATLSAPATVELAFARQQSGRRARGRCVAHGKKGARCTAYRAAGRLERSADAGALRIKLTGRIGKTALRPGKYRLRVTAESADGTAAPPVTLAFTITGKRRG